MRGIVIFAVLLALVSVAPAARGQAPDEGSYGWLLPDERAVRSASGQGRSATGGAWTSPSDGDFGAPLQLQLLGRVSGADVSGHYGAHLGGQDRVHGYDTAIGSAGLHGQLSRGGHELSIGGDMIRAGPDGPAWHGQALQYDILGGPALSPGGGTDRFGNRMRPVGALEYGRRLPLAPRLTLRPFAQARIGGETLTRIGADLEIGQVGAIGPRSRNRVTGFHDLDPGAGSGLSMVLGADLAHVSGAGYGTRYGEASQPDQRRDRLRAGVSYQHGDLSVFYGMTWQGQRRWGQTGQPDQQMFGALRLQLRF